MDYNQAALDLHEQMQGKIEVTSKVPLTSRDDLSVSYTPGVAEPCRKIAEHTDDVYKYTSKGNMVAVLSDGSAVLGLGNIGAEASLPVMEGKAILFKEFGGVDAFPICVQTQQVDEIVQIAKNISPGFGGINLEDISSPRCFEIEERLKAELDIPVFHDDQHGTAIVLLAGLTNALKLAEKSLADIKIVISGAGAAGVAITRLLLSAGASNIILCDSKGALSTSRDGLNPIKQDILKVTNPHDESGSLKDVIEQADVFIGVSAPDILDREDISRMNERPLVFAMSNPKPEIMPDEAQAGGAFIIATGRSDFPNQLNNVLVFPGIFKGALQARTQITDEMKLAAAQALAELVTDPTPDKIIPNPFEEGIADAVAQAVLDCAQ